MIAQSVERWLLLDGQELSGWYTVPRTYRSVWSDGPKKQSDLRDLASALDEDAIAHDIGRAGTPCGTPRQRPLR